MGFRELGPASALPVCQSPEALDSSPDEMTIGAACVDLTEGTKARPLSFLGSLVILSFVWTFPFLAGVFVILPPNAFFGTGVRVGVFGSTLDIFPGGLVVTLVAKGVLEVASWLISVRDCGFDVGDLRYIERH